jgi:hypothetical protein
VQTFLVHGHAACFNFLYDVRGRHHKLGEQSRQSRLTNELFPQPRVYLTGVRRVVAVVDRDLLYGLLHQAARVDHPLVLVGANDGLTQEA